ncbi:deoxyribose-phosphate aldolase [Sulfurihydrogenibium sp.]|uniref:deoxyribose-phosphate aldolase n=1 Tax=Sulfurihydrogenibium sp. TaxID=2053621 RepID=UPI00263036BE|nr:deoxyribose-phosphate aldolase [Sulfurihydrogenibium sp.]
MINGTDLPSNINKYIDQSVLKPFTTYKEIENQCQLAIKYNFASICVNPFHVSMCYQILKNTDVKVCSVVGFPLGLNTTYIKIKESVQAVEDGAKELDIVWNISAFKSKDYKYVEEELKEIIKNTPDIIHKIIVETAYLSKEEKITALQIVINSGAEFIKTSTGFAEKGAEIEDVKLWKELSKNQIKIKASGGIKDLKTMLKFIKAGADRIGTSSGVQIIQEAENVL